MKICILGDLHIGARGSNDVLLRHQERFFNFMFSELEKRGVNTIIQLGDIWDNRRQVNFKALQFANDKLFEPIEKRKINFHTLIGNHDIFYRETLDINSSELLLNHFDHIHVYNKPTTLTFDGCTFDMIPWICDDNKELCESYIAESKSDYCCGHFEINEFEVMRGVTFDSGMTDMEFTHFLHVFSGHFHIASTRGNISYVGTPYELNWGDYNTKKGFVIFDTETRTWERVKNPISYYKCIVYDDSNKTSPHISDMNLEDCFVKLVIKHKTEEFLYNSFIKKLFAKKPADVKFVETNFLSLTESENTETEDVQVKDTIDLITNYIDELDYPQKDELKKFMISLYQEALTESDKL